MRRAHSLSGVFPLGAFLVLHVLVNASSLAGEQRFLASTRGLQVGGMAAELVLVVLPLLFHAGYGFVLARRPASRSPYPEPWRKALRMTGYVAFAFVLAHVWQTSMQKWTHGLSPSAFHSTMEEGLSSTQWGVPWNAILYIVGIGCACVHFAIGVWGVSVTWNLSRSDRAKRRVAWTAGAVGALLFLLGATTVVRYATGTNVLTGVESMPDGPPRPACAGSGP